MCMEQDVGVGWDEKVWSHKLYIKEAEDTLKKYNRGDGFQSF